MSTRRISRLFILHTREYHPGNIKKKTLALCCQKNNFKRLHTVQVHSHDILEQTKL